MKVIRGYKTELDLNNEQKTACLKHAGCARFAYNWGLARCVEAYHATGKRPTAVDLHRELNALKRSDFPWMYEVSKCAMQEALRDLDKAYQHFFRRLALKKAGQLKGKVGFPAFKKRSKAVGSLAISDSSFGEIRRQLEYKAKLHGTHLVIVDRFYPSSKTCSACGYVKPELDLSKRIFTCEACGLVIDRDLNAAINLRTVAVSSTDTQNA